MTKLRTSEVIEFTQSHVLSGRAQVFLMLKSIFTPMPLLHQFEDDIAIGYLNFEKLFLLPGSGWD